MPVVVTRAPIFTCELGPDGQVQLEAVERFDIWVHTERRRVYARSESGLDVMANALDDLRGRASSITHDVPSS